MARIDLPPGDKSESERLMRLQPAMGNAMGVLAQAIYSKSGLAVRVREAVRMRIAQLNQCQICLNYRFPELAAAGIDEQFYGAVSNWRTSDLLTDHEKLAIEYAERFIEDHLNIDETFFERLRQAFTSVEIYELTTTIAGLLANGRLLQVLQVEQHCAI